MNFAGWALSPSTPSYVRAAVMRNRSGCCAPCLKKQATTFWFAPSAVTEATARPRQALPPCNPHSHVTHTPSTVWLLLSRHDTTTPLSFFSPSEPPAAFAALLLPFVATFVAHSLRTGLPWYPRRSFLRFIRSVHCAPHHGTRPRRPGQSSLGKEVVLEYELACTTLPSVQWRMCCMYVLLYECAVCMCCLYVLCGPS